MLGCDGVTTDGGAVQCGDAGFEACAPLGACCLDDGACANYTPDLCELFGGTYRGDGTACAEGACGCCQCFACLGAACRPDSGGEKNCEAACEDLQCDGFVFVLDGSCDDAGGCFPVGACCDGEGLCEETSEALCAADGRAYRGDGTRCEEGACGCCQCSECGSGDAMCGLDSGADLGCSNVCSNLGCDDGSFVVGRTCGAGGICVETEPAPAASPSGLIAIALVLVSVALLGLSRRMRR